MNSFTEEDLKKMKSGSEEGEKIVKIFFDIFFKEFNEETAKLVVKIKKKMK